MSLVEKIDALKMAQNLGCKGTHKDEKGNWMPCSSMDELNKISNRAEPKKKKSEDTDKTKRSDGKKKRRAIFDSNWEKINKESSDDWETLEEAGVISIDRISGGGIISGKSLQGRSALTGPEYVRDSDPDVFPDIESARMRGRQLGCIGVSRRISKAGRTVWMPCTNMSDYARLAGTTSLGRRHQRRSFENAVRTVLMSNDKRPKRKVSIYQELYKK
jgi:hypothetical protein